MNMKDTLKLELKCLLTACKTEVSINLNWIHPSYVKDVFSSQKKMNKILRKDSLYFIMSEFKSNELHY